MAAARLGYICLGSHDPSEWASFGQGVLGTMVSVDDTDNVRLKVDDHPFRILVAKSAENALLASAWEVDSQADYEQILAALKGAGHQVRMGDESEAKERCVSQFFKSSDPSGNEFEVYYGRTGVGEKFQSPAGIREFVTGSMGMGHVVVPAPNLEETRAFYETFLGLRLSDDLTMPGGPNGEPDIKVLFFHADNPRHHSLALFNQPVPSKIVHFMLEVTSLDEVGQCLDRVKEAEVPLMATLGRHCNDNMVSFYVFGPGHIPVEFGFDGLQLDPSNYTATKSTIADHWGHLYQML